MKEAHPYEMPAFDCFKLYNDRSKFGLGRIGALDKPMRLEQIIGRIKKHTGARAVGMVGDERRLIRTAAVCAGYCGRIINMVIAEKADLYLTGELKHHQAMAAREAGLSCICLSHSVSERFILKKFAGQLQKQIEPVKIKISKKDTDPFNWKRI
jgi:putative NIF3 family GTP cyclohydrolase 1 type 2